jgi:hypothetical protein
MSRAILLNVEDQKFLRFLGASKHLQEIENGLRFMVPEVSPATEVEAVSCIPVEVVDLTDSDIFEPESMQIIPMMTDVDERTEAILGLNDVLELEAIPQIEELCVSEPTIRMGDIPQIKELSPASEPTMVDTSPHVQETLMPEEVHEKNRNELHDEAQQKERAQRDFPTARVTFPGPVKNFRNIHTSRLNKNWLKSPKETKSLPPADSCNRIRFEEYFVRTEKEKEKVRK